MDLLTLGKLLGMYAVILLLFALVMPVRKGSSDRPLTTSSVKSTLVELNTNASRSIARF